MAQHSKIIYFKKRPLSFRHTNQKHLWICCCCCSNFIKQGEIIAPDRQGLKTWITIANSTWQGQGSKYKVHKLHRRCILKRMPPYPPFAAHSNFFVLTSQILCFSIVIRWIIREAVTSAVMPRSKGPDCSGNVLWRWDGHAAGGLPSGQGVITSGHSILTRTDGLSNSECPPETRLRVLPAPSILSMAVGSCFMSACFSCESCWLCSLVLTVSSSVSAWLCCPLCPVGSVLLCVLLAVFSCVSCRLWSPMYPVGCVLCVLPTLFSFAFCWLCSSVCPVGCVLLALISCVSRLLCSPVCPNSCFFLNVLLILFFSVCDFNFVLLFVIFTLFSCHVNFVFQPPVSWSLFWFCSSVRVYTCALGWHFSSVSLLCVMLTLFSCVLVCVSCLFCTPVFWLVFILTLFSCVLVCVS